MDFYKLFNNQILYVITITKSILYFNIVIFQRFILINWQLKIINTI